MATSDVTTEHLSLRLTHEIDEYDVPSMTDISAVVLHHTTEIGKISAVMIDRQRIATNGFYQDMDAKSGELQLVSVSMFEKRLGRTTLRSLAEHDDTESNVLYISTFHLESQYNKDSSVAAAVLRKFLYHPFLQRKISLCIYILDPAEHFSEEQQLESNSRMERIREKQREEFVNASAAVETPQVRQERLRLEKQDQEEDDKWTQIEDELAHRDALAFFRNGFFQDPALARIDSPRSRFVVASRYHWDQQLANIKTQEQVENIPFLKAPPSPPPRTDTDAEIVHLVQSASNGLSSTPAGSNTAAEVLTKLKSEIRCLVQSGGSISRANAVHVAVGRNNLDLVDALLEIEPACVHARDQDLLTPLMVAASSAAGRQTGSGIQGGTRVLERLLYAGADKAAQDKKGRTAYGIFRGNCAEYATMMRAMTGGMAPAFGGSAMAALEAKLMPSGGPAPGDAPNAPKDGFVVYEEEVEDYDGDY